MTYREIRRKLEILGCRFQRQADESHELWVNPANGRRTPIPRHGNRDLATGTRVSQFSHPPPDTAEKTPVWSAPRAGIIFLLRQVRTKRKITA